MVKRWAYSMYSAKRWRLKKKFKLLYNLSNLCKFKILSGNIQRKRFIELNWHRNFGHFFSYGLLQDRPQTNFAMSCCFCWKSVPKLIKFPCYMTDRNFFLNVNEMKPSEPACLMQRWRIGIHFLKINLFVKTCVALERKKT